METFFFFFFTNSEAVINPCFQSGFLNLGSRDGSYKPLILTIIVYAHIHVHIVLERKRDHNFHQILQQFINLPFSQLRTITYILYNIGHRSFYLSSTILGIVKDAEVFIEYLHQIKIYGMSYIFFKSLKEFFIKKIIYIYSEFYADDTSYSIYYMIEFNLITEHFIHRP